jgi:hypothetical protein
LEPETSGKWARSFGRQKTGEETGRRSRNREFDPAIFRLTSPEIQQLVLGMSVMQIKPPDQEALRPESLRPDKLHPARRKPAGSPAESCCRAPFRFTPEFRENQAFLLIVAFMLSVLGMLASRNSTGR